MSGKTRPSQRAKVLSNVDYSNLSYTDKKFIHDMFALAESQQAEIERLQTENNIFQRMQRDIVSYDDMKKSIIQDFIDRLLKVRGIITLDDISKIKKEMVGEDK